LTENPFDDDTIQHQVLVNEEGQYSLWPSFAEVPAGWIVAHGPADRTDCLDYVDRTWVGL
jgi:MbtH protein